MCCRLRGRVRLHTTAPLNIQEKMFSELPVKETESVVQDSLGGTGTKERGLWEAGPVRA